MKSFSTISGEMTTTERSPAMSSAESIRPAVRVCFCMLTKSALTKLMRDRPVVRPRVTVPYWLPASMPTPETRPRKWVDSSSTISGVIFAAVSTGPAA